MKYILENLLKVRHYHEVSRSNEMKVKKEIFNQTGTMVRNKKKQLADYSAWRLDKEAALFEAVREKAVRLRDLDDLKLNIGLMRQQEAQIENDVQTAEKALESARMEWEQARAAYYQAVRDKKKIEEHQRIWLEEMTRDEERALDNEMEEFHGIKVQDMEEDHDQDH